MFVFMTRNLLVAILLFICRMKVAQSQYSDPNCEVCEGTSPPLCAPLGGTCNPDGSCLNNAGEPKACRVPRNECFGKYCATTHMCGINTKDCIKLDDCQARQKEMCADSMKESICTNAATGEGCPSTFECRITSSKSCLSCNLDGLSFADSSCREGGYRDPEKETPRVGMSSNAYYAASYTAFYHFALVTLSFLAADYFS